MCTRKVRSSVSVMFWCGVVMFSVSAVRDARGADAMIDRSFGMGLEVLPPWRAVGLDHIRQMREFKLMATMEKLNGRYIGGMMHPTNDTVIVFAIPISRADYEQLGGPRGIMQKNLDGMRQDSSMPRVSGPMQKTIGGQSFEVGMVQGVGSGGSVVMAISEMKGQIVWLTAICRSTQEIMNVLETRLSFSRPAAPRAVDRSASHPAVAPAPANTGQSSATPAGKKESSDIAIYGVLGLLGVGVVGFAYKVFRR